MLDAGGEVGKKLDFLLQEMNRETNTILSKTSGVGRNRAEDHGSGAGCQGRHREDPGAGAEP